MLHNDYLLLLIIIALLYCQNGVFYLLRQNVKFLSFPADISYDIPYYQNHFSLVVLANLVMIVKLNVDHLYCKQAWVSLHTVVKTAYNPTNNVFIVNHQI